MKARETRNGNLNAYGQRVFSRDMMLGGYSLLVVSVESKNPLFHPVDSDNHFREDRAGSWHFPRRTLTRCRPLFVR